MTQKNGRAYTPRISLEIQNRIIEATKTPSKFSSLTDVANKVGVSKNTVKAFLDYLVDMGRLSENNYLLNRTRQDTINTKKRVAKRRDEMLVFVIYCIKNKKPVSVNLLQKKFGG